MPPHFSAAGGPAPSRSSVFLRPRRIPCQVRAAFIPTADPQLELRWVRVLEFLIQGFRIECLHCAVVALVKECAREASDPWGFLV
eukprot:3641012-Pyramimonas_sp.AAC.1